jgi:hypothetical protein
MLVNFVEIFGKTMSNYFVLISFEGTNVNRISGN